MERLVTRDGCALGCPYVHGKCVGRRQQKKKSHRTKQQLFLPDPSQDRPGQNRLTSPQNVCLPEKVKGALQVAQAAQVHVGRVQGLYGRQVALRFHPGSHRVFLHHRGEVLLGRLGEEEVDEFLCGIPILRGFQNPGAGHQDQGTGISVAHIVLQLQM